MMLVLETPEWAPTAWNEVPLKKPTVYSNNREILLVEPPRLNYVTRENPPLFPIVSQINPTPNLFSLKPILTL